MVGAVLAISALAQDASQPMPTPPRLPVTVEKNWKAPRWRVHEQVAVWDTWEVTGKRIATLAPDTVVEGLGKLQVIHQPDVFRMIQDIPEFGLRVGDTVFRYQEVGEGFADVWFNGRWYPEYDATRIERCDPCRSVIEQKARKEWWAHVRLMDGRDGWMRIWFGLWWY